MARIYISSSYQDLRTYRRRVAEKVRELGHTPVGMEADGAQERPPIDVCLEDVRGCDGYICIIGFRYGSYPPGRNISYTELEYDAAAARGNRMIFVAAPDATGIDPPYKDTDPLQVARLQAFRQRVAQHSIAAVSSVDDLATQVDKAIRQNVGTGEPIPSLLPHLCDRKEQEETLRELLSSRLPDRPAVLIVHGDRQEAQRRFLERLRKVTLPELLQLPERATVTEYRLTWPETASDLTRLRQWLARELGRVVLGPERARTVGVEDLFRRMAAARMPTLVSALADGVRWDANELQQIVDFVQFWQECPDYPSTQPLIVCLAVSYPALQQPKGWLRSLYRRASDPREVFALINIPAPSRISFAVAPRLGQASVSRQHVSNWLDLEVRPRSDALRINEAALERYIDRIFSEYETRSGTSLIPMGPLAEQLEIALSSCRHSSNQRDLFE